MLFLAGVVFLLASFGISGWMRSRRLGIATTSLALIGRRIFINSERRHHQSV
jgi:hypothetical protein